MNKFLLTLAEYPDNRQQIYTQYASPRFKKYADMHDFKFIEVTPDKWRCPAKMVMHDDPDNDKRFSRWYFIQKALDEGAIKDDDIITYFDCDVYIAKPEIPLITNKSFSYAVDSGNTHCTGVFSLKVNDYTRKLIKEIISNERYQKLRNKPRWKENFGASYPLYDHDQDAYYHIVGLPAHSWESYYDVPNYGFHTEKEDTSFSLEEILDNTEILPTEWDVTHLVEETGDNGKPNTYDINRTTKDKVIARHFAGGQKWDFQRWIDYCE
jgi:hypothetical protein